MMAMKGHESLIISFGGVGESGKGITDLTISPGMIFQPFPAGCFTEELDVAALVSPEAHLSDAIDGASTAYAELADQVATSQHQRAPP